MTLMGSRLLSVVGQMWVCNLKCAVGMYPDGSYQICTAILNYYLRFCICIQLHCDFFFSDIFYEMTPQFCLLAPVV